MATELFLPFDWWVADRYELVRSEDHDIVSPLTATPGPTDSLSETLIAPVVGRLGLTGRGWRLDEARALYLEFSNIEEKPEAILAFASEFGRLGHPHTLTLGGRSFGVFRPAETLRSWISEMRAMREAVQLLDEITARDDRVLGRVRSRGGDEEHKRVLYASRSELLRPLPETGHSVPAGVVASIADNRAQPHLLRQLKQLDISDRAFAAARVRLQVLINAGLRRSVTVQLLLPTGDSFASHSPHPYPLGLIGALWLQLMRAVARGVRYGACENCGGWFEREPSSRANRRYCSDRCRYQKRDRGSR